MRKFKNALVLLLFVDFLSLLGFTLYKVLSSQTEGIPEWLSYSNPVWILWFGSIIVLFAITLAIGCWEDEKKG